MTVKWKICENCGKRVNEVADKCPYCNSTSFLTDKIIVRKNNSLNKLKHELLYWKEDDGGYVLSKTKVFSIIIYLVYPIFYFVYHYQYSLYLKTMSSIIYGTRFSILVYMIGYLYHGIKKQNKSFYDLLDIKFISLFVLFISALLSSISKFAIGLIFSIIIFIVGNVLVNYFDINLKEILLLKLGFNMKKSSEHVSGNDLKEKSITELDKMYLDEKTTYKVNKDLSQDNLISNLKYGLFYWNNDNGMFTFSKTKFIALLIILVWAFDINLNNLNIFAGIFIGLIFAFPVFFVGWIFHKSRESNDFINYNNTDKGLVLDIIHTFLYWGDDVTSNFRLSKTKIISLLVFFLFGLINASNGLVVCSITGLIFAVPAFGIGYLIHQHNHEDILDKVQQDKKIEPKKEPPVQKVKSLPEKPKPTFEKIDESKFAVDKKEEVETPKIHPSLLKYKIQVDNLTKEFESKESNTRQLIEKRFGPPQLTYTKFISSVDKSSELFTNQVDAIMTVLNLATEENEAIDLQIKENINVLKLLIGKLDELSNELVLNIGKSKSKENDLNNFIDSMDDLIDSVKDY